MKERRVSTVLFADIVGFTPLSRRVNAETLANIINENFNLIDSIIKSFSGTIVRHEGDRVMAVFGLTSSTGNDSYYALSAALKINKAIQETPYRLGVHIGVATGEILILEGEVFGIPVEEAAKLEEMARENEILVNREAYEINKHVFRWEIGESKISLIGRLETPTRFNAQFFDREDEIKKITKLLEKGENLIVISGPRGIGKTHLIYEALRRFELIDNTSIYEVIVTKNNFQVPYNPFIEVARFLKPDFRLERDPKMDEKSFKVKIFFDIKKILQEEPSKRPVIIILQDIENIDSDSFELFKYLLEAELLDTTFFIETCCSESQALEELKKLREFPQIELSPLEAQHISKIIKSDETLNIDEKSLSQLISLSGGNPLIAKELVTIYKNKKETLESFGHVEISLKMRELASAIVDSIPQEFRHGLSLLSSLKVNLGKDLLNLLAGESNSFNWALEKGILKEEQDKLLFKDELVKIEIYKRLSKDEKIKIHKNIAEILESHLNDPEYFGLIGYHFEEAKIREKAIKYTVRWADYLKSIRSSRRALEAYFHAYQLLDRKEFETRFHVISEMVGLYNLLGDRQSEIKFIEELMQLAQESEREDWKLKAKLAYAKYLRSMSEYEKAREILENLIEEAAALEVYDQLGVLYYELSELDNAIFVFKIGLEIALKQDNINYEAQFNRNLGLVYWRKGEYDRALNYYKKAISLYNQIGDEYSLGILSANMGSAYFYLGQYTQSLNLYMMALQQAERAEDKVFEAQVLSNIGGVYLVIGELEKALQFFEKALTIDKQILNKKGEAVRYNNIGTIYGQIGYYEKALDNFIKAYKIDCKIGNKSGMIIKSGNIANCYAQLKRYPEAEEYFNKAISLSEELGLKNYLAYYHNEFGYFLIQSDRIDEAEQHIKRALNLVSETKDPSIEIGVSSNLAYIYFLKGSLDEALKFSSESIEKLEKLTAVEVDTVRIYYNHYKILAAKGEREKAGSYLDLAYQKILEQANQIKDEEMRKKFLQNEFYNKVIEEWKES